ncbi:hypothetical protein [Variovorax beijingensis]|uniref:hypothetical protein n=1 Tax=Variovorax beijingensis TaxID=2496117 RepID=UPI0011A1E94C|nr:hypothetical protein [Variovorax beijingensis]
MKFLDIVPSWLCATARAGACCGGRGAHASAQGKGRCVQGAESPSDEKLDCHAENTRHALAALEDLQRVLAMQAAHAKAQKENVDAYEKETSLARWPSPRCCWRC